jgi:hypothetical protein
MEEAAPTQDAGYQRGLREAVASGVDYAIDLIEEGLERDPQVPVPLIVQSRLAALQGIPLETVIRRYLAGKTLLAEFILEEAAASDVGATALLRMALATHESAFDLLLPTVTDEYRRQEQIRQEPSGGRLLERVRRLLAGGSIDLPELDYDFDRNHLGIVVTGSAEARPVIRQLAAETNSRPLIVKVSQAETWAWLGSKTSMDTEAVGRLVAGLSSPSLAIGIGEPIGGCSGWRLTHRQAQAAALVAQVSPDAYARYAEVAMVTGAAESPLLLASLRELYLIPLGEGHKGQVLRETLRAYFSAGRNSASAASALGVSRQTVANRLDTVEGRIGQPLNICAEGIDVALRLEELGFLSSWH